MSFGFILINIKLFSFPLLSLEDYVLLRDGIGVGSHIEIDLTSLTQCTQSKIRRNYSHTKEITKEAWCPR